MQGQSPGDCDKQVAGEVSHLPAKIPPCLQLGRRFPDRKGPFNKGMEIQRAWPLCSSKLQEEGILPFTSTDRNAFPKHLCWTLDNSSSPVLSLQRTSCPFLLPVLLTQLPLKELSSLRCRSEQRQLRKIRIPEPAARDRSRARVCFQVLLTSPPS